MIVQGTSIMEGLDNQNLDNRGRTVPMCESEKGYVISLIVCVYIYVHASLTN